MDAIEGTTKKDDRRPITTWTVMVFMGIDPLSDAADLAEEAENDVREMREALRGSTKDVVTGGLNVFVQKNSGAVGKRLALHTDGDETEVSLPGANNGAALVEFVKWALGQAYAGRKPDSQNDHCMLVLWGHAYRFSIGPTTNGTGVDALDFSEMAQELTQFQRDLRREFDWRRDPKLDILGFDSCGLSIIEVAAQLAPFADYLIGSQIGVPLPGWPYKRILERLRSARDNSPMTPSDLGRFVVRRYCEFYLDKKRPVSLTLLNLAQSDDVFKAAEQLAEALSLAALDEQNMETIYNLFFRSQTWKGSPFVDVADLCLNLWRYSDDPTVRKNAAFLGDILIRPTATDRTHEPRSAEARGLPFIVEHGRNSHETARLQGVSLYAPHVAAEHDWAEASYWYKKLRFANQTMWTSFVQALAQVD